MTRRTNHYHISVIEVDGVRWMPAIDVCKALAYRYPSASAREMLIRCSEPMRRFTRRMAVLSLPVNEPIVMLNLNGVISFCLKSDRPGAESFQTWVREILKREPAAEQPSPSRNVFPPASKEVGILSPDQARILEREILKEKPSPVRNVELAPGVAPTIFPDPLGDHRFIQFNYRMKTGNHPDLLELCRTMIVDETEMRPLSEWFYETTEE